MMSVVTKGKKTELSGCCEMVVGVLEMKGISKPFSLWSVYADTSKCVVFRGPCGFGINMYVLGVFTAIMQMKMMAAMMRRKNFHFTVSIQPQEKSFPIRGRFSKPQLVRLNSQTS